LNQNYINMYGEEDYNCPTCGLPSTECESTDHYSFICTDCGTEFETPDI
jgi:endogenous inhibitor of DNA gyrase (YacG/DUF329 family)